MVFTEKIMPVEELLHENEFTGRVEILREFEHWIEMTGRRRAATGSIALIAPRRMGKTVLLERLVNTVFFKPEYRMAPFFIKIKREETTLRKFLWNYAVTFFRQFMAYCLQDPVLYKRTDIPIQRLLEIKSDDRAIQYAQEFIGTFLERYEKNDYEDTRNHWDDFIKIPEDLAVFSGVYTAVIIDEFQDMKFYIYDTDDKTLEMIKERNQGKPGFGAVDLTATYDRQALSKKAPMLVSGSAVTLIFRTVMGGPLGGRFGFKYLKPLSIPDGAALLTNLAAIYLENTVITPEIAVYTSTQVGGHPYYLYCLAVSDYEHKSFASQETVDALIQYEIQKGKIYGFWQTHFHENREYINHDNNQELGKKIIYYFTKYNNQPVDLREIADKLKVPKEEVEKKLEKLYQADLVYRTEARYFAFNDICLMRFIKFVLEKDLEDVEKIDLSEQGKYNELKGRFLEILTQNIMQKFNREKIDGQHFGKVGTVVEPPLFQTVNTKYAKGEKTGLYQMDVYGKEYGKDRVWVCECKYRKNKMSLEEIKKVEQAVEALKQEASEEGRNAPPVTIWLISTGGFTVEALEYLKGREDIYYSDYEGMNRIHHLYGGSFDIPVFLE